MTDRGMKVRLGLLVVASLAAVVLVVYLVSSLPGAVWGQKHYTIILVKAAGVGPGTPVRRSGVRIGKVVSVQLDEETGKVQLGIVIDPPHKIYDDETPTLATSLLGDSAIDFEPNPPPPTTTKARFPAEGLLVHMLADPVPAPPRVRSEVPPGSIIEGRVPPAPQSLIPGAQESFNEIRKAAENFNKMAPTLEDAVSQFRDLTKEVRAAVPDLRRTNDEVQIAARNWGALGERANVLLRTNEDTLVEALNNANDALKRFNQLLSDDNLRNASDTLKNTRAASDHFESIAKNADAFTQEARATLKRADEALNRLNSVLQDLEKVSKPLGQRGDVIVRNLDESLEKFNRTMTDVKALMRILGEEDGTVQRLLKDPALYNNLNEFACGLAKLTPQLDRIARDFSIFADKIARHPESLGVGGVVRPGSGIK